jgi:hypothetical protein
VGLPILTEVPSILPPPPCKKRFLGDTPRGGPTSQTRPRTSSIRPSSSLTTTQHVQRSGHDDDDENAPRNAIPVDLWVEPPYTPTELYRLRCGKCRMCRRPECLCCVTCKMNGSRTRRHREVCLRKVRSTTCCCCCCCPVVRGEVVSFQVSQKRDIFHF